MQGASMNNSVHMLSEVMAGSMTTADGTADVAVRLTYKPRDPHAFIVTITERAGVVLIWTIGRGAADREGELRGSGGVGCLADRDDVLLAHGEVVRLQLRAVAV